MKINSIHLKNYRNHADRKIEFTDGLNLLLGKNGAGKSSFLEAFGIAMFAVGNRSGNKLADLIKFGEKAAIITIDFTGNDGIDYILECKITKSRAVTLKVKGENSSRIGREQVDDKLFELSGIEKSSKSIFKNVVSAYQNEITGIFSGTEEERKTIFNAIFDTSIYEDIWKFNLKYVLENYNKAIEIKNSNVLKLDSKIIDSDELKVQSKSIQSEIEKLNSKIVEIKNNIASISDESENLKNLKIQISALEKENTGKQELLKSKQEEAVRNQADLDSALKALSIVNEKKELHDKYNTFNIELSNVNKEIKTLESYQKQYENLKDEINETEKLIVKNSADKTSKKANIIEKQNYATTIRADFEALEIDFSIISNDFHVLQVDINNKNQHINSLKSENERLKDFNRKVSDNRILIDEKKNQLADENSITSKLKELKATKNELDTTKDTRAILQKQLDILVERIAENEAASKELNSGLCPILKESCKNVVEGGTSVDGFFKNRINLLIDEKNLIIKSIEDFDGLDKSISDNNIATISLRNALQNNEKVNKEIEKIDNNINILNKDIEICTMKIDTVIKDAVEDFNGVLEVSDIEILLESWINQVKRKENQLHSISGTIKEKNKLMESLQKEIATTENTIAKLENELKEIIANIDNYKEIREKDSKQLSEIADKFSNIDSYKENASNIEQNIAKIKPDYELYMQNLNIAGNLEKYKQSSEEINSNISVILNNIKEIQSELLEKQNLFSQEKLDDLIISLKNLRDEERIFAIDKEKFSFDLGGILQKIIENENNISERKNLLKEIAFINKKISLAGYFRSKIKDLGHHVAKKFIERIEIQATENYRNISGKTDRLHWSSEKSYQVFIVSDHDMENARKFDVLSGGEQVTVALSLRAAMASTLTSARFAIFDEPTVNLDIERRAALAESLNSILQDLDQAIVVTHDNTFMEIAQNTIELL